MNRQVTRLPHFGAARDAKLTELYGNAVTRPLKAAANFSGKLFSIGKCCTAQ
jgi:hypothetical protein